MNRSELFHKTITTLNEAWRIGKLEHGDQCCCAVGNMLNGGAWYEVKMSTLSVCNLVVCKSEHDLGMEQIDNSGYTVKEILAIEEAFERCEEGESEKQHQYNGLVAVFEELALIHEVDISIKALSMESLNEVYAELA